MKKRMIAPVFLLLLMAVFLTITATAVEIVDSGYCGSKETPSSVSWTLTDDRTLTISGSGTMADYERIQKNSNRGYYIYVSNAPWSKYIESIKTVVIEPGITSIGSRAFYSEDRFSSILTRVEIPNSVISIGEGAFYNCNNLTNVEIPNSVISIGNGAFGNCRSLTRVEIPNSVISLGGGAFDFCNSLTSVEIPESITSIKEYTFANCTSLRYVYIPDSVTFIGEDAFYRSGLTNVRIPNSITSLGTPDGGVFADCDNLTSINIPGSVSFIGPGCFWHCDNLTNITIPASVTVIGEDVFEACKSLSNIYYAGSIEQWEAISKAGADIPRTVTINYNHPSQEQPSNPPIASLSFSEQSYSFNVGKSITLSATYIGETSPSDIRWGCSDETSVTLTGDSSVLGPIPGEEQNTFYISRPMVATKPGTYTVQVTVNGVTATTQLVVSGEEVPDNPPDESSTSLVFDEQSYTSKAGESITLSATYVGETSPADIRWGCSDETSVILTDDSNVAGPFPAKEQKTFNISRPMVATKPGTYTVQVTVSGVTAQTTLTVNPSNSISLSESNYSLSADEIGFLEAEWTYYPIEDASIKWRINGSAVKEYSNGMPFGEFYSDDVKPSPKSTFLFVGVHKGQSTITATLPSGESASCIVTVEDVNPYYLSLSSFSSIEIKEGEKQAIKADVCFRDTRDRINDSELKSVTSIVWESSDGNVVAFDKKGSARCEYDSISHGLFSNTDEVKIYGLSGGKAEITCTVRISGYKISSKTAVSVVSKEVTELVNFVENWKHAYDDYIKSLDKYLGKDSKKSNPVPIEEQGRLLMESDFKKPEKERLVCFLNGTSTLDSASSTMRKFVYQGVAQYLADKAPGEFAKISVNDIKSVTTQIVDAVADSMDDKEYPYTYYHNGKPILVKVSGLSFSSASFRTIYYQGQEVATIISSPDQTQGAIVDYLGKLCELDKDLVKQAYKEALKEVFSKDISGLLEESVKKRVTDSLGNYIARFSETGINNIVKDFQYCLDYYDHMKKVIGLSTADPNALLAGMKELNFDSNPDNVKDKAVKTAMKHLNDVGNELEKKLDQFVDDKYGLGGQVLTDVFDVVFHFHCPIDIEVYNSSGELVGRLNEDGIWYDEDYVYITKCGDEKNIYTRYNSELHFDITGTDDGTLDYVLEEFHEGESCQRMNYYDIPLYDGKSLSVISSGKPITEEAAVVLKSGEDIIKCDETLTSEDYEDASVLVFSLASPHIGGQVEGCGNYVRGDRVALRAIPESNFLFSGWWNENNELVSLDRVYEFTARDNVSLTAMFSEDEYESADFNAVLITDVNVDKTAGIKVQAIIQCPEDVQATTCCVFYKINGQMIGVEIQELTSGNNSVSFTVGSESASEARFIVLDSELKPLCSSEKVNIA